MSGGPAELPAELGVGGNGGVVVRPGGIGGPAEMPAPDLRASAELVREVFRLRERLFALENSALSTRLTGGFAATSRSFLPQELPEGGEGGSTGVFHPPRGEIAELPVARLASELTSLSTRFSQFQSDISKQLGEIQAAVAKQR